MERRSPRDLRRSWPANGGPPLTEAPSVARRGQVAAVVVMEVAALTGRGVALRQRQQRCLPGQKPQAGHALGRLATAWAGLDRDRVKRVDDAHALFGSGPPTGVAGGLVPAPEDPLDRVEHGRVPRFCSCPLRHKTKPGHRRTQPSAATHLPSCQPSPETASRSSRKRPAWPPPSPAGHLPRPSSRSTVTASCAWPSARRASKSRRPHSTRADPEPGATGGGRARGPRALPRARTVGVLERGPVPAGRAARRVARRRSRSSSEREPRPRDRARRRRAAAARRPALQLRGRDAAAAACSASCRRATCRTTASSTRSGSSRRARRPSRRTDPTARRRRAVRQRTCCSRRRNVAGFVLHVEICEDLWVPLPPSTLAALAGATVLANLSASNITVGKADYRRLLCASQSAKCVAAYLYSAAGPGESTTDLAWDGHALDLRERRAAAESERFPLERAAHHGRHRPRSPAPGAHALDELRRLRAARIATSSRDSAASSSISTMPGGRVPLQAPRRAVSVTCRPIPARATSAARRSTTSRSTACRSGCRRPGSSKVVIGISGGLDSTQAALVAVRAFDRLGLPRTQRARLHAAGLRHEPQTLRQRARADAALGITCERDRHPALGAAHAASTSGIRTRRASPSTT